MVSKLKKKTKPNIEIKYPFFYLFWVACCCTYTQTNIV